MGNEMYADDVHDRRNWQMGNEGFSVELENFITAVRLRALEDCSFWIPTPKQITRLVIQIEQALVNPKNRKRVLQAITGLPIMSQRELTWHYHSVLIDETIERKSDELLRQVEALLESRPDCAPVDLFPWYRPVCSLPAVQQADPAY